MKISSMKGKINDPNYIRNILRRHYEKIDELVYKLYNLNKQEINIIEESLKK